jgi:uncharacterized membrane protein
MNSFTSQNTWLFFCVLLSGLLAGLFYGYACSVNIGLGRLSDAEYVRAMQSINKAILNPVFFLSFLGTLLILPIAMWANYNPPFNDRFYLLLTATVIYTIGVFGVTVFGNVPLNKALANFNVESVSLADLFSQRQKFESSWNRLHLIRTVASMLCFAITIVSILKTK